MGLNIKNPEVEKLAAEVAQLAQETKTEAIRKALLERRAQLSAQGGRRLNAKELMHWLETEAWPKIPEDLRGKPISKAEREEILGYGPDGV